MIEALLLLSTASAQVNTSFLATPADRENPKPWTRFTSPTDKFEVLMPAAPLLKQEALRIAGKEVLLNYYGARRGQSDFAVVTLTGLSDHNWYLAHMLMLDWYRRSNEPINTPQAVRSATSFRAIFQKGISLEGYAGRQFSLEGDERVGEWRMYEVNKKFYAVAGSSISRYAYSLRPFFDSFSLSESSSPVTVTSDTGKRVANPAAG